MRLRPRTTLHSSLPSLRSSCNTSSGIKLTSWARPWYVGRVSTDPIVLTPSARVFQGGGVAAAFTAHFPHLVDENVILIASAGLIEVGVVFLGSPCCDHADVVCITY
jgi:hypothetical protein